MIRKERVLILRPDQSISDCYRKAAESDYVLRKIVSDDEYNGYYKVLKNRNLTGDYLFSEAYTKHFMRNKIRITHE